MKVNISSQGHMTKMATMVINSKELQKLLLQNQKAYDCETWHEASGGGGGLYKVYIKHDPWMTLTYFTARSTYVAHAFEWGKLSKCHLMGKT